MFPIVIYTGYTIFPPKTVSCVLSVDTMSGTTVAPDRHDSSDSWLHLSVRESKQFHITHLFRPPPITGIHLTIHPACSLMDRIMSLRSKNQVPCELGVSKDCADTRHNVPKMKSKSFISNEKISGLERWGARQIVDN